MMTKNQPAGKSKIISLDGLLKIRRKLKAQGRTVVLTNGCFDMLHAGHIQLFRNAKALGDVLIVALNDDASIRRLKGPSRPIFPLAERLEVLSALGDIDYVTWFGEDTPQTIIAALVPDVLVKGGDWTPNTVVGRAEVEAAGGKVVIIPYVKGKSTTRIIDKIREISV
ncbi:MAG: D-glycero-beta-D-manno-heptose 1-phosphate adenylyltransferase [Candidatus Aminicenantes bacterium]|nr:D-glycero-beta-D-manno-heptose 1-phosphate adenylyltransferase [Candidatus Aminicenantes bacterium]